MSPNLRKEIEDIKVGTNETIVKFRNGSTISAINASENTRGKHFISILTNNKNSCIILL